MGELKNLQEPTPDGRGSDDDAVERRRHRRERNERLRAGILAMVIAVGGTTFAVRAFSGSGTARMGEPGLQVEAYAFWPERTEDEASVVQQQADVGDPEVAWRLDTIAVAETFARQALGWAGEFQVAPAEPADDGSVAIRVETIAVPCPTPGGDDPVDCPSPRAGTVVVDQIVRPDPSGIWSVVGVASDAIDVDLLAGDPMPDTETVQVRTPLDGLEGAAGFGDLDASCLSTVLDPSGVTEVATPMSIPDSTCSDAGAYLWVMAFDAGHAPPSDDAFDPLGGWDPIALVLVPISAPAEPSLEPSPTSEPDPSDEPDPTDESDPTKSPPAGGPAPDMLEVTCTPDGMELRDRRVQLQPDGIHVAVDSRYGPSEGVFQAIRSRRDDGGSNTYRMYLEQGMNRITWAFRSEPIFVNCFSVFIDANAITREDSVEIEVVDPRGVWRGDQLACAHPVEAAGFEAVGAPSEMEDSAEASIRLHVPGVLDADVVTRSEYPSGSPPLWWLVTREGQNLGIFRVVGDYDGMYRVYFGGVCPGSGIGGA